MRSFRLFVDYGGLHIREAGALKHGFEFGLAEAQPLVRVEFAGFFETMLDQVEDDNAAAEVQNPARFSDGALGVQGVMEGLREEDDVDGG